MVKLIWGYVFQEVIDEHGTLDVTKTSRFGSDYRINNILSFNDALSWYINTSEDGLKEIFELYKISLEIWNESPGRSLKRSNIHSSSGCDKGIEISDLNTVIEDIVYRPYVHLVFTLELKKEIIPVSSTIVKKNAFSLLMARKVPDMIPCDNFPLSTEKKCQPFQETFNNFNNYLKEVNLGHRYNEHDDVYGTKFKGKLNDTSRRKGYGHIFQTTFAILCVKLGPHFKVLSHSGVKIPESIRGTTVVRKQDTLNLLSIPERDSNSDTDSSSDKELVDDNPSTLPTNRTHDMRSLSTRTSKSTTKRKR